MIEQLIEMGKYEEALALIKETKDEVRVYQKILCLYSLKRLNEARIECEILKEYAEKNYYDVIAIYVSILVEMNLVEDAKRVLEEELAMPYIPGKYETIFNETYDELLKRGREDSKSINVFDTITDDDLAAQLLVSTDKEITLMLLDQLDQRNIRRFLPALEEYLKDQSKPRIFKTIILETLSLQGVNKEFTLVSEDEKININPINCTPLLEQEYIKNVYNIFEEITDQKDMNFLEYCVEVLYSYAGNIYPNKLEAKDIVLLACAIIIYVDSMLGSNYNYESKLINDYKLNENELNNFILLIEKTMIL